MAENVILSEIKIPFDAGETVQDTIGLVVGNTYKIVWDSVEYVDVAKQENVLGCDAVVVGNLALVVATEPTDFPFLLGDVPEMGVGYFVSEDLETAYHTVAIYQVVSESGGNVLGTLFQDIADAIRGKTGDTATMKPAEFPDKIAAIEVGGGGSGGGSLPAGLYLKPVDYLVPMTYKGRLYEINGEKYFCASFYSSGDTYDWYKMTDGSFTKIATTVVMENSPYSNGILYNGKIHSIGDYGHDAFDLETATVTTFADPPSKIYGGNYTVWQNKLIGYSYKDGLLYEWDEGTDTWTSIATIDSTTGYYYYPFVINDELYFRVYKLGEKIFHFQNGSVVQIGTLSNLLSTLFGVKGDYWYYATSANSSLGITAKIYKYSPVSNIETFLGDFIMHADHNIACYSNNSSDNFRFLFGKNGSLSIVELVEVGGE